MPIWDYWRTVFHLHTYYEFNPHNLLVLQHNEHRIVFPELVYATDYLLFHGREILPVVCSVAFHIGTWALISWTIVFTTNVPRKTAIAGALLAGIVMGWPGSALLLASPFLLQWTFFEFGSILALVALARVPDSPFADRVLWIAIAGGAVSNYSSGNGLAIWPILFVAALCLGLQRRHVITLVASGFILTALFFVGYNRGSELNVGLIFNHTGYWLGFIGVMLGMPFDAIATKFGIGIGLGSIVLLGFLIFRTARLGLRRHPAATVLFGACLLMLASVLILSFGRIDINDREFGNPKAFRYMILPLVYWGALILAVAWHANIPAPRPRVTIAALGAIALMAAFKIPEATPYVKRLSDDYARYQFSALAIEAGVEDEGSITANIFPSSHWVHEFIPYLREHRVSVFADSRFKWIGRTLPSLSMSKTNEPMTGSTTALPVLTSGIAVVGWTPTTLETNDFVFLDQNDIIVGIGARLPAGLPKMFATKVPDETSAWAGVVNNRFKARVIQAYAVSKNRHLLSQIGSPILPDRIASGSASDSGALIEGITWKGDAGWAVNGFFPGMGGIKPTQGSAWGSWLGHDNHKGVLTSSTFTVPAPGCFIIPIGHGPSIDGQSVTILDTATNGAYPVPLTPDTGEWKYWVVSTFAPGTSVQLIARDDGSGWGQWLSIADPRQCQGSAIGH